MPVSALQNLQNFFFRKGTKNQDEPTSNDNSRSLYQIFISLGPLILTSGVGAMFGFTGIFLPHLKNGNLKNVDGEVGSWIAASAVLPMTVSSLLGGYLMEKIGRKWAHTIPAIPGMLGWITIALSQDISTILVGRILTGVCCGLIAPISAVYIGEVTSPFIRPFVLGCIALSLNIGTLLCHLVGTFFSWQTTSLICFLLPTLGGLFTLFSQETPAWLIRKNQIDKAEETFKKIRGESENNAKELDVMLCAENVDTHNRTLWNTLDVCVKKPEIFKPTLMLILYFVSAQFAGMNVVTFYAISIVEHSLGSNFENKYLVMLSMDCIRTLTSIFACFLLRKLRRRQIAIIGGTGTFICLIILSVSNYYSNIFDKSPIFIYFPLVALLGYVFFISISFVPLPWCLAGELLPQEVKGLVSGVLCFIAFSAFFTAVKCSPFFFNQLGTHFTYLIFATSALFGTLLCYFFLPETKNKTLDDISRIYRNGSVEKK